MKKTKIFILINLILFVTSCGTIKEGFKNQKKNSSDEFLVEKKSPLVMPPSYNQLPVPKINTNNKQKKIDIKEMVTGVESSNTEKKKINKKSSVEELILKSIKKN